MVMKKVLGSLVMGSLVVNLSGNEYRRMADLGDAIVYIKRRYYGIHNLYLKFTGGSGYLFNLNWFKFNH